MSLLDRLETRLGRHAIPGLIRYVVLFNALVYLLQLVSPGFLGFLTLDRQRVFAGEVWRVFTWIFLPDTTSMIWILFALLFLWFLGDLLEASWSSFRINLFYFAGWFLTTLGALAFPGAQTGFGANLFLNLSILLAAATLQPNYQILFLFVIPLKLKWLGWISLLAPALLFASASPAGKAAIVLSLANYLLFFAPGFFAEKARESRAVSRRARFEAAKADAETLHRCRVCGRTEVSHPDLEFRVAGNGEDYCVEHLPRKQGNSGSE